MKIYGEISELETRIRFNEYDMSSFELMEVTKKESQLQPPYKDAPLLTKKEYEEFLSIEYRDVDPSFWSKKEEEEDSRKGHIRHPSMLIDETYTPPDKNGFVVNL